MQRERRWTTCSQGNKLITGDAQYEQRRQGGAVVAAGDRRRGLLSRCVGISMPKPRYRITPLIKGLHDAAVHMDAVLNGEEQEIIRSPDELINAISFVPAN